MLKSFSITLGAFFAIVIIMGFVLPSDYNVKRSIEINASPAQIHKIVGDLNQWSKWTPWQKNDPNTKIEIGSISQGVGASQKWVGSKSGQLKITRSSEDYGVDYDLSFSDDGSLTKSSITYLPGGTTTSVSWNMIGSLSIPVVGAYVALIMDGISGSTLESGLNNLKAEIEGIEK
ncbi:MAG: SRPBCC family protein [Gammaproteobacteria bacterium]|nr:SRPBCC family protein [Gammaproteobacteria bacterium]